MKLNSFGSVHERWLQTLGFQIYLWIQFCFDAVVCESRILYIRYCIRFTREMQCNKHGCRAQICFFFFIKWQIFWLRYVLCTYSLSVSCHAFLKCYMHTHNYTLGLAKIDWIKYTARTLKFQDLVNKISWDWNTTIIFIQQILNFHSRKYLLRWEDRANFGWQNGYDAQSRRRLIERTVENYVYEARSWVVFI